jgi:hypothetical protein
MFLRLITQSCSHQGGAIAPAHSESFSKKKTLSTGEFRKNRFLVHTVPPIDMMRRLDLATIFLLSSISSGNAFTASLRWEHQSCVALFSSSPTTNSEQAVATRVVTDTAETVSAADLDIDIADIFPMTVIKNKAVQMNAGEINTRLENQLSKMKAKDQTSHQLLREVCHVCFYQRTRSSIPPINV